MYELPPKDQWPKAGYYYHYKHDPQGPVNDYAYYISGVGNQTEKNCPPEYQLEMVYRPLYPGAYVYQHGKMFDLRPLHMFFEPAIVDGIEVPRFTRITDPDVIARLRTIKTEMYPEE